MNCYTVSFVGPLIRWSVKLDYKDGFRFYDLLWWYWSVRCLVSFWHLSWNFYGNSILPRLLFINRTIFSYGQRRLVILSDISKFFVFLWFLNDVYHSLQDKLPLLEDYILFLWYFMYPFLVVLNLPGPPFWPWFWQESLYKSSPNMSEKSFPLNFTTRVIVVTIK